MAINIEKLKAAPSIRFVFADFGPITPEEVKGIREKYGLTQQLFAQMLHVSKKTVEKWEQGANPVKGGDEVLLHLLKEDASIAKRLLAIEVENQRLPLRFAFFGNYEYETKEIPFITDSEKSFWGLFPIETKTFGNWTAKPFTKERAYTK